MGTLSQDDQRTTKPAIIDDGGDRPILVAEIIISSDDKERLVTKITAGDRGQTMTGTITDERRQLIQDRCRKGTTLDAETVGNSGDMEIELVGGNGHDDK